MAQIKRPRLPRLSLLAAPRSSAAIRVGRRARDRRCASVVAAASWGIITGRRRGCVGRPSVRRRCAGAQAGRAGRASRPGRLARRGGCRRGRRRRLLRRGALMRVPIRGCPGAGCRLHGRRRCRRRQLALQGPATRACAGELPSVRQEVRPAGAGGSSGAHL